MCGSSSASQKRRNGRNARLTTPSCGRHDVRGRWRRSVEGALLLLPGPWAGDSGSATRSCVAAEGAQRLNRPLACLARAAAPPGGVADLGGCPKQQGIRRAAAMHDRRSHAVESKIGVDLGGSLWCL